MPLKLSDILQTSSQSMRWYPLDGGVGFGRIRISLLFRSVELRLPPPQLGWDIGTFEFISDTITTSTYAPSSKVRLRLRTGGSSMNVKKHASIKEDDGIKFDISGNEGSEKMRLPVRHRYRSPVFMEFYPSGKRHADAFAALWLLELVDGEEKEFDLPVFKCDNATRLSQNYITQDNFKDIPDLDLEEVGRVRFRGRFSPGTDSDHIRFVSDNDSRETIETWEACFAEGVRQSEVQTEVPPLTQKMHDESLTHGRDVLAQASEKDKEKWLAKDGTDWSGAFGKDPSDLMASKAGEDQNSEDYDDFDDDDDDDPDLGIEDGETESNPAGDDESRRASQDTQGSRGSGSSEKSGRHGPVSAYKDYQSRNRDLHRKQRGLMQWRPMRNLQFAKDEAKFALRKVTTLGSLDGRKPDVETEA